MGRPDIKRYLKIGRWRVDFLFCTEGYDSEEILSLLSYMEASEEVLDMTQFLVEEDALNTGFTYSNPNIYRALVVIGPVSSSEEFLNTFTHEIHHLAVAIASNLGFDIEGETPAYLSGDLAMSLAKVICELGCPVCYGKGHRLKK